MSFGIRDDCATPEAKVYSKVSARALCTCYSWSDPPDS